MSLQELSDIANLSHFLEEQKRKTEKVQHQPLNQTILLKDFKWDDNGEQTGRGIVDQSSTSISPPSTVPSLLLPTPPNSKSISSSPPNTIETVLSSTTTSKPPTTLSSLTTTTNPSLHFVHNNQGRGVLEIINEDLQNQDGTPIKDLRCTVVFTGPDGGPCFYSGTITDVIQISSSQYKIEVDFDHGETLALSYPCEDRRVLLHKKTWQEESPLLLMPTLLRGSLHSDGSIIGNWSCGEEEGAFSYEKSDSNSLESCDMSGDYIGSFSSVNTSIADQFQLDFTSNGDRYDINGTGTNEFGDFVIQGTYKNGIVDLCREYKHSSFDKEDMYAKQLKKGSVTTPELDEEHHQATLWLEILRQQPSKSSYTDADKERFRGATFDPRRKDGNTTPLDEITAAVIEVAVKDLEESPAYEFFPEIAEYLIKYLKCIRPGDICRQAHALMSGRGRAKALANGQKAKSEMEFQCPHCDKVFTTEKRLTNHIEKKVCQRKSGGTEDQQSKRLNKRSNRSSRAQANSIGSEGQKRGRDNALADDNLFGGPEGRARGRDNALADDNLFGGSEGRARGRDNAIANDNLFRGEQTKERKLGLSNAEIVNLIMQHADLEELRCCKSAYSLRYFIMSKDETLKNIAFSEQRWGDQNETEGIKSLLSKALDKKDINKKEEEVTKKKKVIQIDRDLINSNTNALVGIEEPGANDVMTGRGGGTNRHPGNIKFRSIVEKSKPTYKTATMTEKSTIASNIVKEWRALDPPGRFLERNGETGLWNDIGDVQAHMKCTAKLREKDKSKKRKTTEVE